MSEEFAPYREPEKPNLDTDKHVDDRVDYRRVDQGEHGGEYVSKEYAEANPDTTVAETHKRAENTYALALRLDDSRRVTLSAELDGEFAEDYTNAIRRRLAEALPYVSNGTAIFAPTDDLEAVRIYVEGRLSGVDSWEAAAKVKAEVMAVVDSLIMDAGLEPEIQTEDLTFSRALELCKMGMAIQREGWNGKDLLVREQYPDEHSKMTLPYLYIEYPDGKRCPWLASQTDLMVEDWRAL